MLDGSCASAATGPTSATQKTRSTTVRPANRIAANYPLRLESAKSLRIAFTLAHRASSTDIEEDNVHTPASCGRYFSDRARRRSVRDGAVTERVPAALIRRQPGGPLPRRSRCLHEYVA